MQNITALVRFTHIISDRRGCDYMVFRFTQYNWNVVESGVKHHNTNPNPYIMLGNCFITKTTLF